MPIVFSTDIPVWNADTITGVRYYLKFDIYKDGAYYQGSGLGDIDITT